jgi:hypothetical protein
METDTSAASARTDVAAVNWRAILAGWIVATGVGALLVAGGLGIALSGFSAERMAAGARILGVGIAVWVVLTWAVAIFLGGMFASWFDARADQTVGALHGVGVWALAITVAALLMSGGLMRMAHRGAPASHAMMSMRDGPTSSLSNDPQLGLQARLLQKNAQMDRQLAAAIAAEALRGDDAGAKDLLIAGGMSSADADQTLQSIASATQQYRADARTRADMWAHRAARGMWLVFVTLLLALVAGAWGGWLGAGHLRRVYHLRRF